MNKCLSSVILLSVSSSLALADDISNSGDGTSVDIFQVASSLTTGGKVDIIQTATDQVNIVLGNGVDNVVTINQSTDLSVANILINAQLPDDTNTGLGNRATGKVADVSVAIEGAVGSIYDATSVEGGTENKVSLIQKGVGDISNVSVDGSTNSFKILQTVDNAVLNVTTHGTGQSITVTQ